MSRSIICKNLTLKIYLEWKITSHFKHVFLTNVEIKHFYNITTSFHIQNNKTQIPVKRVGNKKTRFCRFFSCHCVDRMLALAVSAIHFRAEKQPITEGNLRLHLQCEATAALM